MLNEMLYLGNIIYGTVRYVYDIDIVYNLSLNHLSLNYLSYNEK